MRPPIYDAEWNEETEAIYLNDLREIWDPTISRHVWNQYHHQLETYLSIVGNEKALDILDVGCAQATLALLLAEQGHRTVAVDLRPWFLKYAATRYEKGDIVFVCGNVMQMELRRKFDLIFANQILEHLVYPVRFVERLKGWLKPGGRLIASTPNAEYVVSQLPSFSSLGDPASWEHLQFTAGAEGHFFAYTRKELESIVQLAGLKDVSVKAFETPWVSGHMKVRYLHHVMPYSLLKLLDGILKRVPWLGERMSHQLVVTGRNPT